MNSALQKTKEQNDEILNLKLEINQLQDTIKQEKNKYSKISLENVDIQSKVRFLEKEIARINVQKEKSTSLPPVVPPVVVSDQPDSESDS